MQYTPMKVEQLVSRARWNELRSVADLLSRPAQVLWPERPEDVVLSRRALRDTLPGDLHFLVDVSLTAHLVLRDDELRSCVLPPAVADGLVSVAPGFESGVAATWKPRGRVRRQRSRGGR